MTQIDFEALNREALPRLSEILRDLLPGGHREGREYVVRNPNRADNRPGSFKIKDDGTWADFATSDAGGDVASLFTYIRGGSQVDGARELAEYLGRADGASKPNGPSPRAPDDWQPIIPAPADAPTLTNAMVRRFAPDHTLEDGFWYRDASGAAVGVVARYTGQKDGERSKTFRPIMYCRNRDGRREWRPKGFPAPRPLFGLPQIVERPEAVVLVVEGERTAVAADDLFNDYVVTTSVNGSQSPTKTDWAPLAGRDVVVMPDADTAGTHYAAVVADLLKKAGARSIKIVELPPGLPPGWDVADDLPDGISKADLVRMLAAAKPVGDASTSADAAPSWPEPKPLPSGLLPVTAFDPDMIPASLGPWVADISERMQCPPDFVGIPAVVALAATLGRKIGVRPQAKTDWLEVPNLWGIIVGRPGAMKSPAMNEAMKPLNRLEAEARKSNEEVLKRYNLDLAAHKLRQDEAQKAARTAIKNGATNIADFIDLDEPEKPAARRYIVGDTSYEALGEILVSNPNGILAFRDELVSLLKTLDDERFVNARGFFLTGWNGTSGYPFDRISRGNSYIEAVCVSLLGSTQPGRLSEYLSRVIKDTAGNDGLLQRFALLVWPDDNGVWREVDRYPDTQARTTAWETFMRLNLLLPDQVGATKGEFDAIPSLRLDEAARNMFGEWRQDLETRLRSGVMHSALESHLAKYRKLVPTLALINHLADGGAGSISETAMLRAISFTDYLESHAKRAYGSGTQLEAATAKAILARIRKGDLTGDFTARDVHQHDWSNLTDKEQVSAGLDLLDDLGWIRGIKSSTGGRPKVVYSISPRAFR